MKLRYTEKVVSHAINKKFKCLVVDFFLHDKNIMLHRTEGKRIYKISYMPRVEEMIEIIRAYRDISPEFKEALGELNGSSKN